MAYRFLVDRTGCLNCGACMDVCPVQALDMTRNAVSPVEAGFDAFPRSAPIGAKPWMMEFPVQVDECIGCQICATECPTAVITIEASAEPAAYAPAQGPIFRGPEPDGGWVPLSAMTRESLKEEHTDPWGNLLRWRSSQRGESWQSWRSWVGPGEGRIVAPCQAACPVGTDAGMYVGLIAEGRYADALAVAAEYNPFPSICGRVCTAPCQVACRRAVVDEAIAIRELKRFAADHGIEGYPKAPPPKEQRKERVAIVGSGPTGLSAAYMLARAGYTVTVFEAMPTPGGMMAIGIPAYRLPKDVLAAEIERIVSLGVEIRLNQSLGRDFSLDDLRKEGFDAILLATGAPKSQALGVPGEDLEGVWPATVFLKKVNLGEQVTISGDVLVVGGGSTAMDAARSAWRAGAKSVRVLYRRTREDMPAQHEEVRAAEHEGVTIETLVAPIEVQAHNGWMSGLRCTRLEVTGRDADGRSLVKPVAGSEFVIPATVLMVAVGEAPDPSILPEGSTIQVSDWGGLAVHPETLETTQTGIFAAGDVATGPRSVIEGVAQGQRVAWAIDRFLRKLGPAEYLPPWKVEDSRFSTRSVAIDLANRKRAEASLGTADRGKPDELFKEASMGFTEESARAEAARCLRCDITSATTVVQVTRRLTA